MGHIQGVKKSSCVGLYDGLEKFSYRFYTGYEGREGLRRSY